MRAAIYTRVSREEQTRGHSLESQEADARTYAGAHGYEVTAVYTDPGYSGADSKRPGLQSLISDAEAGKFDVVLVRHVDRLSRDAGHALELSKRLSKAGVDVIPFSEGDASSESDRFMFGIRALVAEQERSRTRERMMRGKQAAAAQGHWHGGEPPYGTRSEPHPDGGSVLVLNEDEAQVVRDIYRWMVDEGLGPYQVAQRLNDAEITTRRGRPWTRQLLKFMLRNPRLTGTATWWGEEVEIPQLLTRAEWVRLQGIFDSNSRKHSNTGEKSDYPLSGVLFDPMGEKHYWIGGKRKGHRYYHCSRHPGCKWRVRRWIRADELEGLVLEKLREPHDSGHPFEEGKALWRAAVVADALGDEGFDPKALEEARQEVDALEEKLGNLYLAGAGLDPGALKRATSALQDELNTARQAVHDQEARLVAREVVDEWEHGIEQMEALDLESTVEVLGLKVHLTGDLTFDLKFDPLPEAIRRRLS